MFSESDPMSGQPVVTRRSAQFAAMVLRISVAVYLLLASPEIEAAGGDRGEDRPALPAIQSYSCRSHVTRHRPDTQRRTDSSSELNRPSQPLTEALRDDRPPQVRVEVRRWRTAILASGGKAPLVARLLQRRFVCGASRRDDPSHSLHELFCTWVI